MALRTAVNAFLAKVEATQGQDALPTPAADAIKLNGGEFQVNYGITESRSFTGTLDEDSPIVGVPTVNITANVELKGSGTAGTPPDWGVLLRGCAVEETVNAGTDVVYTPTSILESLTIYWYADGIRRRAVGCYGNCDFVFTANQRWVGNFTFNGRLLDDSDDPVPTVTVDNTIPPSWRNNLSEIDGTNRAIQTFNLNLNNQIATLDDPSTGQNGVLESLITQRGIRGTLNPDLTLRATHDYFASIDAQALHVLNLTNGDTAGNLMNMMVMSAQFLNETWEDDQGARRASYEFAALGVDSSFGLTIA